MTAEDRDRDEDREALSALMDGETQELELRRVLDSISSDPSLRERWRRQQQVRGLLQGQRTHLPDVDVSTRVRAVLDTKRPVSRNPIWSMAIAASVTLAVVMGGQQWLMPASGFTPAPVVSELGGAVVPVFGAQPVQASLGAQSLPVSNRQASGARSAGQSVAAVYERLARDRYHRLNGRHAAAAAQSHPAPYISYVRVSELKLESSDSE